MAARKTSEEKIRIDLAKTNIEKLSKRRVRINKCIKKLEVVEDITADDVEEAVALLRMYAKRLGRIKTKNEIIVKEAEE